MTTLDKTSDPAEAGLGVSLLEFVGMMAFLMALTALSVDIMLVVLPDIAGEFALEDPNTQQFVVTGYLLAFAAGHIFAGPLSDRLGRRPIILGGLAIYLAGSVLALVAESFTALLIARAVQGFGAAGPRVTAVAVVRDRFVGRAMSRVMSFVMTVFIMLPVVAPALGSLIAALGEWRLIFAFLLLFGGATALWVALRLVETHPRSGPNVEPPVSVGAAVKTILTTRQTAGYMLALGFVFGVLMTYVATSQQLFEDVYGIVDWFPAVFASVAGAMVVASLTNARLVSTLGMRRLSHGALLSLAVLMAGANIYEELVPTTSFTGHMVVMALAFFFLGLILPNFNALAMEPLGRIAGTGSSFVGFVMTGLGASLGTLVGQTYDGTLGPILSGYLACAVCALLVVAVTERGRILRPAPASREQS